MGPDAAITCSAMGGRKWCSGGTSRGCCTTSVTHSAAAEMTATCGCSGVDRW